jgi:DNA-binding CsgD family transcriptional regulator
VTAARAVIRLVGRSTECAAIDALLAGAREERGGALVLRGEAGVGKTALLDYARAGAGDAMTVLSARGVESEAQMPFSALSELLGAVLDRLPAIPERQAAAIVGALGLGPAVQGDRFGVAAATLSLFAAVADSRPLLVLVDDLQWTDGSSAEALLFAARRLDAEPVAMIFAVRDDAATPPVEVALPALAVGPLGHSDSLALLSAGGARRLSTAVGERVFAATAGNPLALIEIPRLLSPGQLAGDEALDEPLPAISRVESAFARRIAALTPGAQTALLLAAANDSEEIDVVLGALEQLELAAHQLEEAELEGLLTVEARRLRFRHPLVRSCVYHGAAAPARRAAHRALADALQGARTEERGDRRAWHLAAASLGPDEQVAQALERAGAHALRRQGYVAAAGALERAAQLSPAGDARAARLLAAARAAQLANRTRRAVGLLEAAGAEAGARGLQVDIRQVRAQIETWRGHADHALTLLLADADTLEATVPNRAAALLSDAASTAVVGADVDVAVALARRAYALAQGIGGRTELLAALQLGRALVLAGDAPEGHPLLMRCIALLDAPDPLALGYELAQCAPLLMAVEEYDLADRVLGRVIDAARAANALGLLPYCLGARAELEGRVGRTASAYANASESVALAREAGQETQLFYNLGRLACLEAVSGREAACRAHVAEARDLAADSPSVSHLSFAETALGLLELCLGRPEAAIACFEESVRLTDAMRLREPGRHDCIPDLVEACVRCGRGEEAEPRVGVLEAQAERTGRLRALAGAARCRGLLADESHFDEPFAAALGHYDRIHLPFERARTELCYGERLRRHGRRIDAREQLRRALRAFEELGAEPWASRARAELAASGQRLRSPRERATDELTAQELQVALIVAGGATNKEAAAALFLTAKTIEFHLGKIYRKLGVGSRTALARRLSEGAGITGPAPGRRGV